MLLGWTEKWALCGDSALKCAALHLLYMSAKSIPQEIEQSVIRIYPALVSSLTQMQSIFNEDATVDGDIRLWKEAYHTLVLVETATKMSHHIAPSDYVVQIALSFLSHRHQWVQSVASRLLGTLILNSCPSYSENDYSLNIGTDILDKVIARPSFYNI